MLPETLAAHQPADAEEAADRDAILAFVGRHENPFDREIREGHLTASALIVSSDGQRTLLLYHLKLERWLQPGGHAESGEDAGETVALREAFEETGLSGLALHPSAPRPLDVDVHDIPARRDEPAHQHLDLRYLVVGPAASAAAPPPGESQQLRWFTWEETAALGLDHGLTRALRKARRYF